jgi:hypothetical protein
MSKVDYLYEVLDGLLPRDTRITDAALYFYHAEVPVDDAKTYLATLAKKLK